MTVGVMEGLRLISKGGYLMFRSFLRIVVVAVIVLSVMLSIAPAAQAGSSRLHAPALTSGSGGWLDAAAAWISRLVSGEAPKPAPTVVKARTGSCIDPMGLPTPCPR